MEYFFEAFELAVLDPQSRIIKSTEEQIPIPPNIISSISFELNNKKKNINFSPGLNVIIGKRGSGKSLLLTIIENLNKSNNKITTDYNVDCPCDYKYDSMKELLSDSELINKLLR